MKKENSKNIRRRKTIISKAKAIRRSRKSSNLRTILFNQDSIIANSLADRLGIAIPNVKEVAKR